jgi:hypothetical protein
VQELTSNDNRSSEQLRVAVEQLMLAAGNQNPDVRLTGSAAPKSGATVKVDAEIENEEDVLRNMRAIRPGPSPRPKQKHPSRTRQRDPALVPLPGALKYLPRAPASDPRPRPRLSSQHGIPASPPQSSAEVPSLLALHPVYCLHQGRNRRPRTLRSSSKVSARLFTSRGYKQPFHNLDWRL